MDTNEVLARLDDMRQAYRQLYAGSSTLLEKHNLFWTERALLRLVRSLYARRLEQVGDYLPEDSEAT